MFMISLPPHFVSFFIIRFWSSLRARSEGRRKVKDTKALDDGNRKEKGKENKCMWFLSVPCFLFCYYGDVSKSKSSGNPLNIPSHMFPSPFVPNPQFS